MESRNVSAFDPTELANAVDENLYDLFRAMAQGLAGGELDERDEGYRYGVLFSTEMGQSVYERIGFRATGTRINRYLWRNASAATTGSGS